METTKAEKSKLLHALKDYYHFSKDLELANFLGISSAVLSNWFKRGTLDYDVIIERCRDLDLNKLLKEHQAEKQNDNSNYYKPDDNIDVVNEKQGSKLSILEAMNKYLDEKIEQKDRKIIQLSLENEAIKKELNELKKL